MMTTEAAGNATNGNAAAARNIRNGWFSETDSMWPGQKFSLALDEFSEKSVLYNGKSEFQTILVFRSAQYGNVLVLDGVIQITERDEFCYHEMMAHLPLFSHPKPKKVLIVGGGDGGILREVCRHSCVEAITMVEIDSTVIEVAKQFFADTTAKSFDDPRLTIVHADASDFVNGANETFDVIIADTLDPVGPGESLFQPAFYESVYGALNKGGVACVQGECIWINLDLVSDVVACCGDIFEYAEYASTMVPTFPCGQTGFILARKGKEFSCQKPQRLPSPKFQSQLRWYNPAVHEAAFVLPEFVKKQLDSEDDQDQCVFGECAIL